MFQGSVLPSQLQKGTEPQRFLGQDMKHMIREDRVSSSQADGFLMGGCNTISLHTADILPGFVSLKPETLRTG